MEVDRLDNVPVVPVREDLDDVMLVKADDVQQSLHAAGGGLRNQQEVD